MDFCEYVNSMVSLLSDSGYLTPTRTGLSPGNPSVLFACTHKTWRNSVPGDGKRASLEIFLDFSWWFLCYMTGGEEILCAVLYALKAWYMVAKISVKQTIRLAKRQYVICMYPTSMYPLTCAQVTWMYPFAYKYRLAYSLSTRKSFVCILVVCIHSQVVSSQVIFRTRAI